MKAIEVPDHGDSDVFELTDRPVPEPGPGEVRIDVEAAGINFADIMQRRGTYPGGPEPPYVPGAEAAGTVDAVGEGLDVTEGDRVVAMPGGGSYAEFVVSDTQLLFPIPDGTSFAEAAGFPVQFLTAHSCLFEWDGLEDGESVLIQAAAGGVGTAAVQLASRAGATVFGTASTWDKLDLAADLGCDRPINYTETDFREVVETETDGDGVELVLESVGGDVFERSLDALTHFSRLVIYGVASGTLAAVENKRLLFENKRVIGFHLSQAAAHDPGRITTAVIDFTDVLSNGDLEVIVGEEFPLEEAAAAHRFIEDRKSTGKVALTP
ncbi:NADPH:quinone oxidoreductase family protein [Natrinema sp. SYSU A 869]|uniref:quinone oxidoreductase family protein n=1 Tax=Natrinema sp. SYSU A 869 TaxID=2871694 RepID=UPI001CA40566|nr:NADPH:quinone oxidoreductase family protein [Natrinema sp. SYSU A 869]